MPDVEELSRYQIGLVLTMPFRSNKDADETAIAMLELLQREYGEDIIAFDFGSDAVEDSQKIKDEIGQLAFRVKVEMDGLTFGSSAEDVIEELGSALASLGFPGANIAVMREA